MSKLEEQKALPRRKLYRQVVPVSRSITQVKPWARKAKKAKAKR